MENWQAQLEAQLDFYLGGHLALKALVIVAAAAVIAWILNKIVVAWLRQFTRRTDTVFDDQLIDALHRPLITSVMLIGLASATLVLQLPIEIQTFIFSLLYTVAMVVWTLFLLKVTQAALRAYAEDPERIEVLHPKTLPLFENFAFVLIIAFAIYYIFVSWNVDMTAWLASAGIVGIAVGFAAKDTLANLFSGVFIMADSPYKIGDFVVLDTGERGEITRIGIRSTRLLTRDDIEVTVPNAVMGNTKIINESGGRHEKFRIRVQVGVAYGSDIDQVREILLQIGSANESVCIDPEPRVRFRRFGPSALEFELLCWIEQPVLRGRILDELNGAVYKAFLASGIEIPFSKQDVYIKSLPRQPEGEE